jgi:ankyrin repeat protein
MASSSCCSTRDIAMYKKHKQCFSYLLKRDGFVFEHRATTALHCAVIKNQPQELIRLLNDENQVSFINTKDFRGNTPLHYASKLGHRDLISILLDHSADVIIHNDNFQNPLDLATPNIQDFIEDYLEVMYEETI